MEYHTRFEPDVSPINMARELDRICNSHRGGAVDQAFLYFDAIGAAGWTNLCSQSDYVVHFEGFSYHWLAECIKDHLDATKFNKRKIDIVGIACGDGKKEGKLIQSLLELYEHLHIGCYLLDKSDPLLISAHNHLMDVLALTKRVTVREHLGDLWKLSFIPKLFDTEESQDTLRVGCMLGGTMINLDNELRFVRDSLHAFKSGDLFIVDVVVGFAPHDNREAIQAEDPGMSQQGIYQAAYRKWLGGVFKQHREQVGEISFKKVLHTDTTTSTFPGTYTVENSLVIETPGKPPISFNMLRQHRYHAESFIGAFTKAGFRRLCGKTYGSNNCKLIYVFIKE